MGVGRKAKPTEVHKLNGNPGQRKNLDKAVDGTHMTELPPPPDWLGKYGAKEWYRSGPELMKMRLLTEADLMVFATYCQNVHIMVESAVDIEENGMTIIGARGTTRNPALASFAAATTALRALAAEFGMTPSSRSRFSFPDDDGESLEDLLGTVAGDEDVK